MYASVAVGADGHFVVTWSSFNQDGDGWGVFGQRYDAAGNKVGEEFQVNTTTKGDQMYSAVALTKDGDFVVVWSSAGQDGDGWGVFGQRFDASGNKAGNEFQVNTTSAGDQTYAAVASDAAGNFSVTWSSYNQDGGGSWDIYRRDFANDGSARGDEYRVNTTTTGDQTWSSIAMNASGESVVTWASHDVNQGGWDVYGQRFLANDAFNGAEFQVTTNEGDQLAPAVALDNNGNFLVTWTSAGQDGAGSGVFGQQYDGSGAAVGTEFRINTTTVGDQRNPSVAMDGHGDSVVVWSGTGIHDDQGVSSQRFVLNGSSGLSPMVPSDAFVPSGDDDPTVSLFLAAEHEAAGSPSPLFQAGEHFIPEIGAPTAGPGPIASSALAEGWRNDHPGAAVANHPVSDSFWAVLPGLSDTLTTFPKNHAQDDQPSRRGSEPEGRPVSSLEQNAAPRSEAGAGVESSNSQDVSLDDAEFEDLPMGAPSDEASESPSPWGHTLRHS
jgi:hypothetical protein